MTVLVTGGNGKTSSRLANLLKQDNIPVLVASRSGSSAAGAQSCRFDWNDESTYGNPFEAASNISSLYIVAPQGFDLLKATKPFIDYSLKKGVKRLVFLSASSIECGEPAHGKVHEYIKSLGVDYGVLRPTWFMQNFSEAEFFASIRDEGIICSATGNGTIPFVSAEDIARVAKHLLTDDKPHNTEYVVLGPELLSYDDVAKLLTEILGKPVKHRNLSGDELSKWFQSQKIPAEIADFLADLDVNFISSGKEQRLKSTAVKDVTGKEPISFRAFAEANKQVWM